MNANYQTLYRQALKAVEGYSLTFLGQYNDAKVYTNREGLYIGQSKQTARKATTEGLELITEE